MRSHWRMFFPRLLLSALLPVVSGPLFAHTFTNDEGKTFEGEISKISGLSVVIVRSSDQRSFTFPISKLSTADKDYVADWKTAHPQIKLDFNVVKDTQRDESGNFNKNGVSSKRSAESFKIEVKNNTPDHIPALVLYYTLVQDRKGESPDVMGGGGGEMSGTLQIPEIGAFGSRIVMTHGVKGSKSSSVYTTLEGEQDISKYQVSLKGLFLVVYLNDKQVAEWKTPGLTGPGVNIAAAKGESPKVLPWGVPIPPKPDRQPWDN